METNRQFNRRECYRLLDHRHCCQPLPSVLSASLAIRSRENNIRLSYPVISSDSVVHLYIWSTPGWQESNTGYIHPRSLAVVWHPNRNRRIRSSLELSTVTPSRPVPQRVCRV